jgi:hypothetical protein
VFSTISDKWHVQKEKTPEDWTEDVLDLIMNVTFRGAK